MRAIITPSTLKGEVTIPPSKSAAHRAIFCAAMASGTSRLLGITLSDDISATISAVRAMGASVIIGEDRVIVDGFGRFPNKSAVIDCGESGSTLRFALPIAAALGIEAEFIGHGRLPERPMETLTDLLSEHGVTCTKKGSYSLPMRISGQLTSGKFVLPGNISSQYISGLLMSLPLLEGDSEIELSTPLESSGYVDMTLATLADFSVEIRREDNHFYIPAASRPFAHDTSVEGDWSQAAFFITAAALGGNISIKGLKRNSLQGDSSCFEIYQKMGVDISFEGDMLHAEVNRIDPVNIDASQIPDLVPALAVALSAANGCSRIYNAGRLRDKESDRLSAMYEALTALGVSVTEGEDYLEINGGKRFTGGFVSSECDHRIVMALAVAGTVASGRTMISDAQSVNKSYPDFFKVFNGLGGNANVI